MRASLIFNFLLYTLIVFSAACSQNGLKVDPALENSNQSSENSTPTTTQTITPTQTIIPPTTQTPTPTLTPTLSPTPTLTSNGTIVTVSWTANKEKAVNSSGGGYQIYYSQTNGFTIPNANLIDVPYTSGGSAPTTKQAGPLAVGTWYFKIRAYSNLGQSGSNKNYSTESDQITISVP